jgi:predicted phage terminase large subunit-like protein
VVGQRWVRYQANRYLVSQKRGRWSFTKTIAEMLLWAQTDNPSVSLCGHLVHQRLIEEKANGAAIIDVLKEKIAGLKPVNPTISKEARARAVTPECESGNGFLPHPGDPGNEWVTDFLSELRDFPHGAADDQVDGLSQGLTGLRDPGRGLVTVPGSQMRQGARWQINRDIARAATTSPGRPRSAG